MLDDVVQMAAELSKEAAGLGRKVSALGLGICELVDRDGNISSANCVHWLDQPVREKLSGIAPVVLEADVRAAALAEARLGEGREYRTFLYVTVGTGISSCLMLDGRPYLGARGATGTMASSPLQVPCECCGQISSRTLEEIASGPALIDQFHRAGGQALDGRDVLSAAAGGDSRAVRAVQTATEALGAAIAQMIGVLDPGAVIVGGGLGGSGGVFWTRLVAAIRRCIWADVQRSTPVLQATTGEDAGWIGAALRAGEQSQSSAGISAAGSVGIQPD